MNLFVVERFLKGMEYVINRGHCCLSLPYITSDFNILHTRWKQTFDDRLSVSYGLNESMM